MPDPRYARYGPTDRYLSPPGAGMCISVFAVVRKGSKVLVGKFAPHERWENDWMPQFKIYPKEELAEAWDTQRIPAVYLREGEHPEKALDRLMREQLGIKNYERGELDGSSWLADSDWYPGHQHWDLVFTYHVKADLPAKKPAWWSELGWKSVKELRSKDFGWNADYVRSLRLAR